MRISIESSSNAVAEEMRKYGRTTVLDKIIEVDIPAITTYKQGLDFIQKQGVLREIKCWISE